MKRRTLSLFLSLCLVLGLLPAAAFAQDAISYVALGDSITTGLGLWPITQPSFAEIVAAEKGYTLVPLQVYFKNSLVKVEIGLAKGKKLYDKRQDIAKKDQRREAERDFKVKNLY